MTKAYLIQIEKIGQVTMLSTTRTTVETIIKEFEFDILKNEPRILKECEEVATRAFQNNANVVAVKWVIAKEMANSIEYRAEHKAYFKPRTVAELNEVSIKSISAEVNGEYRTIDEVVTLEDSADDETLEAGIYFCVGDDDFDREFISFEELSDRMDVGFFTTELA